MCGSPCPPTTSQPGRLVALSGLSLLFIQWLEYYGSAHSRRAATSACNANHSRCNRPGTRPAYWRLLDFTWIYAPSPQRMTRLLTHITCWQNPRGSSPLSTLEASNPPCERLKYTISLASKRLVAVSDSYPFSSLWAQMRPSHSLLPAYSYSHHS